MQHIADLKPLFKTALKQTVPPVYVGWVVKRETGENPVRSRHCNRGTNGMAAVAAPLAFAGKVVPFV